MPPDQSPTPDNDGRSPLAPMGIPRDRPVCGPGGPEDWQTVPKGYSPEAPLTPPIEPPSGPWKDFRSRTVDLSVRAGIALTVAVWGLGICYFGIAVAQHKLVQARMVDGSVQIDEFVDGALSYLLCPFLPAALPITAALYLERSAAPREAISTRDFIKFLFNAAVVVLLFFWPGAMTYSNYPLVLVVGNVVLAGAVVCFVYPFLVLFVDMFIEAIKGTPGA